MVTCRVMFVNHMFTIPNEIDKILKHDQGVHVVIDCVNYVCLPKCFGSLANPTLPFNVFCCPIEVKL